jgi:hypothetical protein
MMNDARKEETVATDDAQAAPVAERGTWQEPKLTFVEPVLVKQGEMKQITTQGFFGTFAPAD